MVFNTSMSDVSSCAAQDSVLLTGTCSIFTGHIGMPIKALIAVVAYSMIPNEIRTPHNEETQAIH